MSAKSRSKEYLPLAKMLSKIIQRTKNILHTSNQLKSWSNEIRILVETQQVDISRVKEVLKWYRTHVGGEYIPVVESGRSLRDKFTRLEAAMQREAKPKKENTTYKKYTADKKYREDGYV